MLILFEDTVHVEPVDLLEVIDYRGLLGHLQGPEGALFVAVMLELLPLLYPFILFVLVGLVEALGAQGSSEVYLPWGG